MKPPLRGQVGRGLPELGAHGAGDDGLADLADDRRPLRIRVACRPAPLPDAEVVELELDDQLVLLAHRRDPEASARPAAGPSERVQLLAEGEDLVEVPVRDEVVDPLPVDVRRRPARRRRRRGLRSRRCEAEEAAGELGEIGGGGGGGRGGGGDWGGWSATVASPRTTRGGRWVLLPFCVS